MEEFYMIGFAQSGNFYFFKDYVNACAEIMNVFLETYPEATEEELLDAANELSDKGEIEDFAWCDKVKFED